MASNTQSNASKKSYDADGDSNADVMIIWVDNSIREESAHCRKVLDLLRDVTRNTPTFRDIDAADHYIRDADAVRIFVITSGAFGQDLMKKIHSNALVDGVYIFCRNPDYHRPWATEYDKIKKIERTIEPIVAHIQSVLSQASPPSTPSSPADPTPRLAQLDPTFRLTQLFKRTILTIDHDGQALRDFARYCEENCNDDAVDLRLIGEFEANYRPDRALRWFTRDCFLAEMLTNALKNCRVEILMRMAFFIKDLHNQIVKLHADRPNAQTERPFTVYRAESYSPEQFQQLEQSSSRWISFNHFLSTLKDRAMAETVAQSTLTTPNTISVLFTTKIDPKKTSTAWVNVRQGGQNENEEEIVFDMHSVFRLGRTVTKSERFYEIELTSASVDGEEIRTLIEPLNRRLQNDERWRGLAEFLVDSKEFRKAKDIYQVLLNGKTTAAEESRDLYSLGVIAEEMEDFDGAVQSYEKALKIDENQHSSRDQILAVARQNIGSLCFHIGNYSKALPFLNKALETWQSVHPVHHPQLLIIRRMINQIQKDSN